MEIYNNLKKTAVAVVAATALYTGACTQNLIDVGHGRRAKAPIQDVITNDYWMEASGADRLTIYRGTQGSGDLVATLYADGRFIPSRPSNNRTKLGKEGLEEVMAVFDNAEEGKKVSAVLRYLEEKDINQAVQDYLKRQQGAQTQPTPAKVEVNLNPAPKVVVPQSKVKQPKEEGFKASK